MIDWQNALIGIVFTFVGISLIISSLKFFRAISSFLITIIGTLFLLTGVGFIGVAPIEFNPALHECTEWRLNNMPREGWSLNLVGKNFSYLSSDDFLSDKNQNKHCRIIYEESEAYASIRDIVACEEMNMFSCVSFRAKTECELENPEYVLENITRVNPDEIDKNCAATDSGFYWCFEVGNPELNIVVGGKELEHPTMSEIFYTEQVCREKSVEELEADYCKENPIDAARCDCVKQENQTFKKIIAKAIYEHSCYFKELNQSMIFTVTVNNDDSVPFLISDWECAPPKRLNKTYTTKELNLGTVCVRAVPKVVA